MTIQFKADKNNRRYIISTNLPDTTGLRKKITGLFIKYTEYSRHVNASKNFNLVLYNEAQESELFIRSEPSHFEIKFEPEPINCPLYVKFEVIKNYKTNTHLGETPIKNENFRVVCFRRNLVSIDSLAVEISNEVSEKIKIYDQINSQDTNIKDIVKAWSHKNLVLMCKDLYDLDIFKYKEYLSEQNYKNLLTLQNIISKTKKTNMNELLKEPIFMSIFSKSKNIHEFINDINKKCGVYDTTPLMFASAVSPQICELLINYGADPLMKDSNGLTSDDYKKYSNELFEL
jgi:hypothetical protein